MAIDQIEERAMAQIEKVLIVGGGIAGMSAAIMLRRAGIKTDLIDIDPHWRVYGAGLTITGPTLRALKSLGVLSELMAQGHTSNGLKVCSVDGTIISEIATPDTTGAGVPGAGGILRPVLHKILSELTLSLGTNVRLGITVDRLDQSDKAVRAQFSDGSIGDYDLVVGSDGVFSKIRQMLFPDAPTPKHTGQACWRLMLARPPEIASRHYFLGGPVKVGLTPVSSSQMYMFLLERSSSNSWLEDAILHLKLRVLLEGYGGILAKIRKELSPSSHIVYRPLEGVLLARPWYSGRVVLIGDAVHATTPQLASGAGMSVEDGLVLVDELLRALTVETALQQFFLRRYERCRLVVENSLKLGELEVAGATPEAQAAVVEDSLRILAQPI
jgi:2-polyprenyl-6-methoxyphenol hydroxylase-like FAD-dependent oxidoreductase